MLSHAKTPCRGLQPEQVLVPGVGWSLARRAERWESRACSALREQKIFLGRERRQPQGRNEGNRKSACDDARADAAGEVKELIDAIIAFHKTRVLDDIPVMFDWMGKCFDFSESHLEVHLASNELDVCVGIDHSIRLPHLRRIYLWATEVGHVKLPDFTEVARQYTELLSRARGASAVDKAAWSDDSPKYLGLDMQSEQRAGQRKSSKVIVKDILTRSSYYNGPHDIVYLLQHCMLKTINEAVVESMGCCVDVHADPSRHLSAEKYAIEAFIDRNGPPVSAADKLLAKALDMHFEKYNSRQGDGSWRFHIKDSTSKYFRQSKVVVGEANKPSKLPFMG